TSNNLDSHHRRPRVLDHLHRRVLHDFEKLDNRGCRLRENEGDTLKLELLFLIIYFVGMLGIGVWAMRRSSKSSEGFLLADRSLGPAVTALRLQSSSMSGYMFLGAGSLAYTQGYYSMWYALGDVGGGVLNLSIIG